MALERDNEALEQIQSLTDKGIAFPDLFLDQARILHRQGLSGQALAALDRALELNPGLEPAHLLLARIRRSQGEPDEALAVLDRYHTLDQPAPSPEMSALRRELKNK